MIDYQDFSADPFHAANISLMQHLITAAQSQQDRRQLGEPDIPEPYLYPILGHYLTSLYGNSIDASESYRIRAVEHYRIVASLLTLTGYWGTDTATAMYQQCRLMVMGENNETSPVEQLLTPEELFEELGTLGYPEDDMSPLAVAAWKQVDAAALSTSSKLYTVLLLIRDAQGNYRGYPDEEPEDEIHLAYRYVDESLSALVNERLISSFQGLAIAGMCEPLYAQEYLQIPSTQVGKSKVALLLCHAIDTEEYLNFSTEELPMIVDDPAHQYMPITLLHKTVRCEEEGDFLDRDILYHSDEGEELSVLDTCNPFGIWKH